MQLSFSTKDLTAHNRYLCFCEDFGVDVKIGLKMACSFGAEWVIWAKLVVQLMVLLWFWV